MRALSLALAMGCAGCDLFESQGSYSLFTETPVGRDSGVTADTSVADASRPDARSRVPDASLPDAHSSSPVTIASGEATPKGIVHVGTSTYWANYGDKTIRTASAGGTPRTIATTASPPSDMVTDQTYVYTVVGASFHRGSATNGVCTDYVSFPLASDAGGALQCGHGNGTGDSGVVFTGGDLGACSRIGLSSMQVLEVGEAYFEYDGVASPAPGGAGTWHGAEELLPNPTTDPGAIVSDGVTIYAVFGSSIWAEPLLLDNSGSLFYQSPDSTLTIQDLAVDETYIYWVASDGSLNKIAKDRPDASAPMTLATNLPMPWRLALYEGAIYWTNRGGTTGPGSVQTISTSGNGPVMTLAPNQDLPFGIFVDFTGVYWTSSGDGTVKMIPLP